MTQTLQTLLVIGGSAAVSAALAIPANALCGLLYRRRGLEQKFGALEKWIMPIFLALCGGLFGWRAGLGWELLYLIAMLFCCTVIACTDIRHRIIPNVLVLSLIVLAAAAGLTGAVEINWLSSLGGFAFCFVLFLLPALFSRKVGAGDVKLAAAMGFCAGFMGSLYAIAAMGGLVLLYVLIRSREPAADVLKKLIPMGPFLAVALLAVQMI